MKKCLFIFSPFLIITFFACTLQKNNEFVYIKGGNIKNTSIGAKFKVKEIDDFYIGKFEVTQKQWKQIMGYNPSAFKGENLPVEMVSWYDCIEYCNLRSEKDGLEPYYYIYKDIRDSVNHNENDTIKWLVEANSKANGYRLPSEIEWEFAASGGFKSKGYAFSGGDNIYKLGWFWKNSGEKKLTGSWDWNRIEMNKCQTQKIGMKKANELGLFDMSGNVREWCFNWYEDEQLKIGYGRIWKGGGWIGDIHACKIAYRGLFEADGRGPDQGLRLARNAVKK